LIRERLIEGAGSLDRVTRINAGLGLVVLALCALTRNAVAFAPLVILAGVVGLGPIAVSRSTRPELVNFAFGLIIFSAMAAAAGVTGGPTSPIAYLLPVGIVIDASRGAPRATAVGALLTAAVFLGISLMAEGIAVIDDPLPMVAILAGLASVTLAATALAGSEIRYRRAAVLDPLTGLLNRQGLEDRFAELREQALLSEDPICLLLFDLDHFKQINDEHGHDVGDAVLRQVAYEVRKCLRKFELVYRIGGEEFLVILPGVGEGEGELTAEHLRATVEGARVRAGIGVTASFGVSGASGEGLHFEGLYRSADQALYQAKRDGRDRVRVAKQLQPI
jgi:diguanylate cyclase (GGDEF)-like protein